MAIIGKIREKSLLVLIVVGLGMLLFIIPFDQIANFGSAPDNSIGEINGKAIDPAAWNFDNQVEFEKYSLQQQGYQINDDQARARVFNRMINDTLLNTELRAIGLTTSDEELNAIIWGNYNGQPIPVSSYVQNLPYFQDRNTRQFSMDSLKKILPMILAQDGNGWPNEEINISRQNIIQKYLSMITKGIIVTDIEAKGDYFNQNQKANFKYAYVPYSNIEDSTVAVTDADLEAYFNERKGLKRYEMEESRSFEFVSIPVDPSKEDVEKQFGKEVQDKLIADWKVAESDSAFVILNSVNKYYAPQVIEANTVPADIAAAIDTLGEGAIFGPYQDAFTKTNRIGKIVDLELLPEARVRHILVGFKGDQSPEGKNKAFARADSIRKVLKGNINKFDDLLELTDDPASIPNGGVYEWFDKNGQYVQPFKDFALEKSNFDTKNIGVVETQFGYHVMEVLGYRETKRLVRAAFIDKVITPSKKTIKNFKFDLDAVVTDARKANNIDIVASKYGVDVKEENDILIAYGQMQSPELENNQTILKWAFNALPGEISEYTYLPRSNTFIVARSTKSIPHGPMSLATAKTAMKDEVTNMKKVEKAQAEVAGKSVEEIAGMWGVQVIDMPAMSFAATGISGQTDESDVIGEIFNLKAGTTSPVLKGKEGMYVVYVNEFVAAAEPTDLTSQKIGTEQALAKRADQDVMVALRDAAGVRDDRMKRRLSNDNNPR